MLSLILLPFNLLIAIETLVLLNPSPCSLDWTQFAVYEQHILRSHPPVADADHDTDADNVGEAGLESGRWVITGTVGPQSLLISPSRSAFLRDQPRYPCCCLLYLLDTSLAGTESAR